MAFDSNLPIEKCEKKSIVISSVIKLDLETKMGKTMNCPKYEVLTTNNGLDKKTL